MSTVTAPTIPVALPKDLVREIDEVSAETGFPRVELIRAAIRRFALSEQRWRDLQAYGAERAKALGIETEEDLEALLDSFDESADTQ
jgi:metal-responsive CopG/Arc/MetJ family transcriptional regulator